MTTTTTPQPPSTPETSPTPKSSPTPESSSTPNVPLAVWPVAQTTAQWQRAGRYLPACARHPGKMLPELARRIIAEYCEPGALVVDPLASILGNTAWGGFERCLRLYL